MAKLPTYQSNIEIQPTAAPNLRAGEETERVLSDADRQANKAINSLLSFEASQKGKEEGQSLDFKPSTPVTRFQVIEQRRALQANQVYLTNNIRDQARKIFNEEIQPGYFNGNSPERYREKMEAYLNDIVARAPAGNKEYAQNFGNWIISKHESVLQNRAIKYDNQEARADLDEYLTGLQESAFKDAVDGNYLSVLDSMGQYGQGVRKINEAVRANVITPEAGASIREKWKTQLQTQSYIGQYKNLLNEEGVTGASEFMQKFITEPTPKDMSMATYQNIINGMSKLSTIYAQAQKIQDKQLSDATLSSLNQVASGIADPDSDDIANNYSNLYAMHGQDAANKYSNKVDEASTVATRNETLKFLNPQQFDAAIEKMQQGIDPNTHAGQVELQTLSNAVAYYNKQRKEFNQDPKGYTDASPIVQQAASRQAINPDLSNYGVLQDGYLQNANYLKTSIDYQLELGASMTPNGQQPTVSVVSKQKAQEIASQLNAMNVEQQVFFLTNAAKPISEGGYGQYTNIFYRDLAKYGYKGGALEIADAQRAGNPDVQYAIQARMSDQKTTLSLLPSDSIKNIQQQIASRTSANLQSFAQSMTNYGLGLSSVDKNIANKKQNVITFATWLYANNKAASPKDAVDIATKLYAPYAYKRVGNNTVRFPDDYDSANAVALMKYKMSQVKNLKSFFGFDKIYGKDSLAMMKLHQQNIESQGGWVTLPDDSGTILVDGNGAPVMVTGKDGKPTSITVNFDRANDPINKEATKAREFNKNFIQNQINKFNKVLAIAPLAKETAQAVRGQ